MMTDRVETKEYIPNFGGEYVYCLTVAEDHTLAANGIFTGQCDGGDEDCVMLLMDGLINFSRSFLPETRGGSMDAPLVLTSKLDPAEVDGESHNVDACRSYPIELYDAALAYRHPKELSKIIDHLENRLGTPPGQYEGVGFTHDTSDISAGPLLSTYTTLGTMSDKLEAELELAGSSGPWTSPMSQNGCSRPISSRICRAISTHSPARNSGVRRVMPNTAGCRWQANAAAAERLSRPCMRVGKEVHRDVTENL